MKKKKNPREKADKSEKYYVSFSRDTSILGAVTLIALLSVLFVWPLFLPTFFRTHDDFGHIIRLSQFIDAFKDGQFLVRWLPDLMGGYGLPVFVVYPPLPSYLGSLFHLFGLGITASYKAVYIIVIPLSGIAMFLFTREIFEKRAAILTAVAYMCAPSHLLDVYVKGGFNEVLSFIFVPLIFLGIKRASDTGQKAIPLLALSTAGLALSHSISTMLAFPWIIVYAAVTIFITRRYRALIYTALGIVLGLGISAIYWLVAFVEKDYTTVGTKIGGLALDFRDHFVHIGGLLAPAWDYGYSGIDEPYNMSFQIGSLSILALTVSFIAVWYIKDRTIKTHLVFFQFMALTCIVMMVEWSKPLWGILPLIEYAQFPWRFLNLLSIPTAFMMGALCTLVTRKPDWYRIIRYALLAFPALVLIPFYVLEKSPQKIKFFSIELVLFTAGAAVIAFLFRGKKDKTSALAKTAIAMIILTSLLLANPPLYHALWKRPAVIKDIDTVERVISAEALRKRMEPGSSFGHLFLPKTATKIAKIPPQNKVDVVRGNTVVSSLTPRSNMIHFSAETDITSELLINTYYFPGWTAYVDGEETEIDFDYFGRIHLTLQPGKHWISLRFEDTPVRKFSKLISATSLVVLALWVFFIKRKKRGAF